ncbi:MAG TPA: hypothetical protein VEY09_11950 [Pyrinomonadaceae bacterium]|nr:hypothetical protein [Pyrinomonadaceae bacterium]
MALAEFDRPDEGGNSDGVIDAADAVYVSLRLWCDEDHDGLSRPGELHPLWAAGVGSISLSYREAMRRDRHGNRFRYRAKVYGSGGPWAYDVFLLRGQ